MTRMVEQMAKWLRVPAPYPTPIPTDANPSTIVYSTLAPVLILSFALSLNPSHNAILSIPPPEAVLGSDGLCPSVWKQVARHVACRNEVGGRQANNPWTLDAILTLHLTVRKGRQPRTHAGGRATRSCRTGTPGTTTRSPERPPQVPPAMPLRVENLRGAGRCWWHACLLLCSSSTCVIRLVRAPIVPCNISTKLPDCSSAERLRLDGWLLRHALNSLVTARARGGCCSDAGPGVRGR